jgi:hypothetical protein
MKGPPKSIGMMELRKMVVEDLAIVPAPFVMVKVNESMTSVSREETMIFLLSAMV